MELEEIGGHPELTTAGIDNVPNNMEEETLATEVNTEVQKPAAYPIEEIPYFPLNRLNVFVYCAFCNKSLTQTLCFQCAECENFYMCSDCLMKRCEKGEHHWNHGYRVCENLGKMTLYVEGWSAEEELRLMEGMQAFRFGNWEEISHYVGTKSEQHCVHHYTQAYLSNQARIPDPSKVLVDSFPGDLVDEPVPPYTGPGSDINGYNALRNDYDVEYDNDAEVMLKDVEILGDEDEKEKELKMCLLRAFNRRLAERNKRKQFVLERNLLDLRSILSEERKMSKEEQDINNRLKPFARFLSPQEYDSLLQGLIKEARLRERIMELQKLRRNGVRTLEEAEMAELDPSERDRIREENGGMLNVNQMDGAELLTPEEKRLCGLMHMVPRHYLAIKTNIIQECCKNGFVSREEGGKKITIDVERKQQQYDFFVSCGWITAAANVFND